MSAAVTTVAGLDHHFEELGSQGYTIVPDVAPPEFFDEIRARILELSEEQHRNGIETFNFGPNTEMIYKLLVKGRVFEQAALNPTLQTLMTHLLGPGYVASVVSGSILRPESHRGPLHSDNQFFPEPFPPHADIATAVWCCDDFDEANGSTWIVPGSHAERRHPRPGDREHAIPVVAPKGSLVLWNGHTWHASGGRTAPGERVVLHTAFARMHLRSFESYDGLVSDEILARNPPEFARLVGADLPWGFTGPGPDATRLLAAAQTIMQVMDR